MKESNMRKIEEKQLEENVDELKGSCVSCSYTMCCGESRTEVI